MNARVTALPIRFLNTIREQLERIQTHIQAKQAEKKAQRIKEQLANSLPASLQHDIGLTDIREVGKHETIPQRLRR